MRGVLAREMTIEYCMTVVLLYDCTFTVHKRHQWELLDCQSLIY